MGRESSHNFSERRRADAYGDRRIEQVCEVDTFVLTKGPKCELEVLERDLRDFQVDQKCVANSATFQARTSRMSAKNCQRSCLP